MITHKHLRQVIEDIYLNDNRITEELLLRLINEFRYSNLYIPAKRQNNTLNFIIYEDEGEKITPLFTDLDEFHKFYRDGDVEVLNNSFELYRNILKTTDIEGFVLNPASEKYLFKKEFILSIENIPKTNFFATNPYSEDPPPERQRWAEGEQNGHRQSAQRSKQKCQGHTIPPFSHTAPYFTTFSNFVKWRERKRPSTKR